MKLTWNDLQNGTKLYILVPYVDENNFIQYEYQESEVICAKPYKNKQDKVIFINVRFKYTDKNGKRQRVNCQVHDITNSIAKYPYRGPEFGKIIISFESKDKLREMYTQMISDKIEKLNSEISKLREQSIKLERTKYANF